MMRCHLLIFTRHRSSRRRDSRECCRSSKKICHITVRDLELLCLVHVDMITDILLTSSHRSCDAVVIIEAQRAISSHHAARNTRHEASTSMTIRQTKSAQALLQRSCLSVCSLFLHIQLLRRACFFCMHESTNCLSTSVVRVGRSSNCSLSHLICIL